MSSSMSNHVVNLENPQHDFGPSLVVDDYSQNYTTTINFDKDKSRRCNSFWTELGKRNGLYFIFMFSCFLSLVVSFIGFIAIMYQEKTSDVTAGIIVMIVFGVIAGICGIILIMEVQYRRDRVRSEGEGSTASQNNVEKITEQKAKETSDLTL